jgi:hypothetical protein
LENFGHGERECDKGAGNVEKEKKERRWKYRKRNREM